MNETDEELASQASGASVDPGARKKRRSPGELAQKGGIVVALIVTIVAVFVAFQAVTDAISTWLQPRWVPIWRAVFALGVAGLALYVIRQLTRVSWSR